MYQIWNKSATRGCSNNHIYVFGSWLGFCMGCYKTYIFHPLLIGSQIKWAHSRQFPPQIFQPFQFHVKGGRMIVTKFGEHHLQAILTESCSGNLIGQTISKLCVNQFWRHDWSISCDVTLHHYQLFWTHGKFCEISCAPADISKSPKTAKAKKCKWGILILGHSIKKTPTVNKSLG